jgi:hypothetical protein
VTTHSRGPSGAQLADLGRRRPIQSTSFEFGGADWVDSLVDLLREAGYPKAARAEIVGAALEELLFTNCWRHALARKTSRSSLTARLNACSHRSTGHRGCSSLTRSHGLRRVTQAN